MHDYLFALLGRPSEDEDEEEEQKARAGAYLLAEALQIARSWLKANS